MLLAMAPATSPLRSRPEVRAEVRPLKHSSESSSSSWSELSGSSRSSRVAPRGPDRPEGPRLGSPMLVSSSSSRAAASGLTDGKSGRSRANDSSGSLCRSRSEGKGGGSRRELCGWGTPLITALEDRCQTPLLESTLSI